MKPVNLCFLFHMHQPWYRDMRTGRFVMPWVRLHACKGYTDMAMLADRHPDIRFTVNMVPSLVEQLQLYASGAVTDSWKVLSLKDPDTMNDRERAFLLEHFFSVNRDMHMPAGGRYRELLVRRERMSVDSRGSEGFSTDDFRDLQVLFNLAWMGWYAFEHYPELREMKDRDRGFNANDAVRVVAIQDELVGQVLERYRERAVQGVIELTTSPRYHPILPLLVSTDTARRCQPDSPLPPTVSMPAHAFRQLSQGAEQFAAWSGQPVSGLWPSEGSVSPEVLELAARAGFNWFATDEDVLDMTDTGGLGRDAARLRPWRFDTAAGSVTGVFRNKELSDMIGFRLYRESADTAVPLFIQSVHAAARKVPDDREALVAVVLDGENPWEQYPESGLAFLDELMGQLAADPAIRVITISDALERVDAVPAQGPIHSGSWINGDFRIWIGHQETNRAWQMLGRSGQAIREAESDPDVDRDRLAQAVQSQMIAEGSDWFWWYGDDFDSDYLSRFDDLFRTHLKNVYHALGRDVPGELDEPLRSAGGATTWTAPQAPISPRLTGKSGHAMAWRGAGCFRPHGRGTTMFEGEMPVREVLFGMDSVNLYIRISWVADQIPARVMMNGTNGHELTVEVDAPAVAAAAAGFDDRGIQVCWGDVLELAIPRRLIAGDASLKLVLELSMKDGGRIRFPRSGSLDTGTGGDGDQMSRWRLS